MVAVPKPPVALRQLISRRWGQTLNVTAASAAPMSPSSPLSGNRLSVECASLEAVMGQALDHPHIVKTLMFLARGRDGPMVRIGGGGDGGEGGGAAAAATLGFGPGLTDGTPDSAHDALHDLLMAGGSAATGGGGGGRCGEPSRALVGQAVSLPAVSRRNSSTGAASGRSRLSLPAQAPTATSSSEVQRQRRTSPSTDDERFGGFQAFMVDRGGSTFDACGGRAFGGPAAGEGSTGPGWMEGSSVAAGGRLRGGFMGDPATGEDIVGPERAGGRPAGTRGKPAALEPAMATEGAVTMPVTLRATGSETVGTCGDSRSLANWFGSGYGATASGNRGLSAGQFGAQPAAAATAAATAAPPSTGRASPASLVAGIGSVGTNRSSNAYGGNSHATDIALFPGGSRGGTALAAVPEAMSSSADDTSTHLTHVQPQELVSSGARNTTHVAVSPFSAGRANDGISPPPPTIAEDPCVVFSTAMVASLHQSHTSRTAGGGGGGGRTPAQNSAAANATIPPQWADRSDFGRVGNGSSNMMGTGEGSSPMGPGGPSGRGGSVALASMDSSQMAAAARLTSASALWRLRQGSTAAGGGMGMPSADRWSGSFALRAPTGAGAVPSALSPRDTSGVRALQTQNQQQQEQQEGNDGDASPGAASPHSDGHGSAPQGATGALASKGSGPLNAQGDPLPLPPLPRTAAGRAGTGTTSGSTGESPSVRPPLQQRLTAMLAAGPAPQPSKGSGASWFATAGSYPSAIPAPQLSQGGTTRLHKASSAPAQGMLHRARPLPLPPLPPSVSSDSTSAAASGQQLERPAIPPRAPAAMRGRTSPPQPPTTTALAAGTNATGAQRPSGTAPSASAGPHAHDTSASASVSEDPEFAAAMEAHSRALMLLTNDASSGTAGTAHTVHTALLSSASTHPQPHSRPASRPHPHLQRAMAVAQEASRRATTPSPTPGAAPVSAFAAASQRRLSTGPFEGGPGLVPPSAPAEGPGMGAARGALGLATAPSADAAQMRTICGTGNAVSSRTGTAPVGFPGTAAEASAVMHGGTAAHLHAPGKELGRHGGARVAVEAQGAGQQQKGGGDAEEEEAEGPEGAGGGSFSDVESDSELMGMEILDSPRTAARKARMVG